jgi:PAS domain S-box-containing protein
MDQLLSSIEIGAVFVDKNLGIRRFNAPAARFINLLEQDVGRPLSHLSHDFGDAPLLDLCGRALRGSQAVERLLIAASGARVLFHARGLPAEDPDGGLVLTFTDVTSVHVERESRHLLDEALQHADVPIALLDPEGNITLANRAFARQFDRDAKWLAGLAVAQLLSSEEHASFSEQLAVVAKGESWHGVVHSLRANGELFQESLQLAPLRSEEGGVVGVIRLTERTFNVGTVEGASITGTYTWDVRTDEAKCSVSLYDVLGMKRGGPAISMQTVYPMIIDEDQADVDRNLAVAMDSAVPHEFSFRVRRLTGEVQRVGSRMLPDRLPTGELRRVIGVMWVIHGADKSEALDIAGE